MHILLFESIAFGITAISLLYGVFKVNKLDAPFYFKMIVKAVACYTLEELWVIVDAICGVDNQVEISVRLVGIFACFCTLLSANIKSFSELIDNKSIKSPASKIGIIAPIIFLACFLGFAFNLNELRSTRYIIIVFIVVLPAIIDSYYELKHLFIPRDNNGLTKYIRLISTLILTEYVITFSYLFIQTIEIKLTLDIISSIIVASLIIITRRGALKCRS